jgi:UPF0755 protein
MQERFSDCKGKEKAGTYELNTKMTPEDMLKTMSGLVLSEDGKTWVEASTTSSSSGSKAVEEDEDLAPEEEEEPVEAEGEDAEESEGEEKESD